MEENNFAVVDLESARDLLGFGEAGFTDVPGRDGLNPPWFV